VSRPGNRPAVVMATALVPWQPPRRHGNRPASPQQPPRHHGNRPASPHQPPCHLHGNRPIAPATAPPSPWQQPHHRGNRPASPRQPPPRRCPGVIPLWCCHGNRPVVWQPGNRATGLTSPRGCPAVALATPQPCRCHGNQASSHAP